MTLSLLLLVVTVFAISMGAVHIRVPEMWTAVKGFIHGEQHPTLHEAVFLQLRLPRVLLCLTCGGILSLSGVLMQGLFRNPIVEPGLTGTSAGAAFGASVVFVLAAKMDPQLKALMGAYLVPLFAFAGALLATWVVYLLARGQRRISVMHLLLIGIAVNALAVSGTGFMSYIARDPQARSITFWSLGIFSGASWVQVLITTLILGVAIIIALLFAKKLNALLLGEEEAASIGVNVTRLKKQVLLLNTVIVAIVTSFVGVVSFIGLIVPHMMRSFTGSDHKKLIPASVMAGGILVVLADLFSRIIMAPAELPVGIITSFAGAPVFIYLLKKTVWLDNNNV